MWNSKGRLKRNKDISMDVIWLTLYEKIMRDGCIYDKRVHIYEEE